MLESTTETCVAHTSKICGKDFKVMISFVQRGKNDVCFYLPLCVAAVHFFPPGVISCQEKITHPLKKLIFLHVYVLQTKMLLEEALIEDFAIIRITVLSIILLDLCNPGHSPFL